MPLTPRQQAIAELRETIERIQVMLAAARTQLASAEDAQENRG